MLEGLFCKIRKRETALEFCRTCGLAAAETTRENVTVARGLFQASEFFAAYKDIEAAREAIRDGKFDHSITRSISCLESVMRIVHEKLAAPLPDDKAVTTLWKSTRSLLRYEECDQSGAVSELLNALPGVISKLGAMRNALGDAHGRGSAPPAVSESLLSLP